MGAADMLKITKIAIYPQRFDLRRIQSTNVHLENSQ